ncbi:choline dehydrogenase [Oceanospirillum multiglobuliferum]|uniref:Oxygen-dependent choline dehydrogenase n=1 Tax=Oceanospirillum multiglobuliferum TaxID=64969 RepID=A0A1T4MJ67_9GAMM|nr:choline dehydrogenase [Oceanospirillum multiglobuliferum]OPX57007.1 choline dehydrogenase [Oceanospirillum multiglobuliferum]SJZ66901.1 choline dehydrogenase [Oceanospirillum multiglobuliferum]
MNQEYDYIIIGAGSAGCVLADRLTACGEFNVLLLERGGSDQSIFVQMPTALSYPMNTERLCWQFHTEPEAGINGRSLHTPRGKTLGGSSSINGMVYVRGHACDFDQWVEQGATGWDYQSCLPYFKKAETWIGGANQYRGGNGPVGTCNGNNMSLNPLYQAFIDSGVAAGYPATEDYNGYQQEGFGAMHMTVRNGVRSSTSNAYLRRAMKRSNLTVLTGVLTRKIQLEASAEGLKATGVEFEKNGQVQQVSAYREVISCAGAIGSPHLLQLSGIGPKAVLEQAGVPVLHDLAGVGENLQDHLEVYFQYQCKQPISLNSKLNFVSMGLIGAQWLFFKNGLGATNHFESCAFIRSKAGVKWPDIQYHFLPAAMRYDGKAAFKGHGFQVHVGPNKPASRGRIWITSADPKQPPKIQFNYLSHPQDVEDWRACIRLTREILQQAPLESYRGDEIQPGLSVSTDAEIDTWVRDNVESAYHPSCSCKMGADTDPMAVLDEQCQVRGVDGLRVVDASIFPIITNGNLNAPTIMVAEKAADLILGNKPLPKAKVAVWLHPHYAEQQR